MTHRASRKVWQFFGDLVPEVQKLARENYELLKRDPRRPSLHFKKVGRFWSVRIGIHFRAIAVEDGADLVWFWIGRHHKYELIIGERS